MDARPSVVLPQLSIDDAAAPAAAVSRAAQAPHGDIANSDMTRRDFMPADDTAGQQPLSDRYRQPEAAADVETSAAANEAAPNPFVHKASAAEAPADSVADQSPADATIAPSALELPAQGAEPGAANPLRRLNAASSRQDDEELTESASLRQRGC